MPTGNDRLNVHLRKSALISGLVRFSFSSGGSFPGSSAASSSAIEPACRHKITQVPDKL
jgi:hypothetical protein